MFSKIGWQAAMNNEQKDLFRNLLDLMQHTASLSSKPEVGKVLARLNGKKKPTSK